MVPEDTSLEDTLDCMAADADGSKTSVGEIIDDLERRGFGPFIAVFSVFVLTPVGIIPGVPALVGIAIILFAGQIMIGRKKPWFPQRLRDIELDSDKLERGVEVARPWARRLSKILHPRLTYLATGNLANMAIALVCIATAFFLIIIGFIPGLPVIFGVTILCFGLGLTTRDGLAIALGYAVFGTGAWLAFRWM